MKNTFLQMSILLLTLVHAPLIYAQTALEDSVTLTRQLDVNARYCADIVAQAKGVDSNEFKIWMRLQVNRQGQVTVIKEIVTPSEDSTVSIFKQCLQKNISLIAAPVTGNGPYSFVYFRTYKISSTTEPKF
jgi:hypothetical protein